MSPLFLQCLTQDSPEATGKSCIPKSQWKLHPKIPKSFARGFWDAGFHWDFEISKKRKNPNSPLRKFHSPESSPSLESKGKKSPKWIFRILWHSSPNTEPKSIVFFNFKLSQHFKKIKHFYLNLYLNSPSSSLGRYKYRFCHRVSSVRIKGNKPIDLQ